MDLPKRKRLRLEGYDYSSNGAYFLTICVEDKRALLGSIVGCDDPGALMPGGFAHPLYFQRSVFYPRPCAWFTIHGVPGSSRPTMLLPAIVMATTQ